MKLKLFHFILTCFAIAAIFAGTLFVDNHHENDYVICTDLDDTNITLECDGPDGVMLQ